MRIKVLTYNVSWATQTNYILVDKSAKMINMYVPPARKRTLFSDHKPVVAEFELF